MSENLVKGVLLQDDSAGGARVGLFDYDNLANRPNFGGSQNGNDITQWAGSVNKLIPFEINVRDDGKNDSSTDTQEVHDITLLHNDTEVTFEDIRDMVVNGITIVCIYKNRLLPFVYNTATTDSGRFYFQAGGGSVIYQIVVSKSSQQLYKVGMALGGTLDKVINELYGVEDGKIPADGASRLDNLLYCYFDPSSEKLYRDKAYTQQLTRAELQTFVSNGSKEYQRQAYCIWPSYAADNQGRYLRLAQCGGASEAAKFSGFYYNDKNDTWDFKTVLLNADSSATGKEWTLDLSDLEKQNDGWRYGSILTAFADINADTIGQNADDQDGVVVSYNSFGRLQILVTKDLSIDEELRIQKSCDLILNGHTLEKTNASKHIRATGREIKIFGGDFCDETFASSEKRGQIISNGQTGILVASANFLIQDVRIETTNNTSGSTYGISDNIGSDFPTKEVWIKNCEVVTKSSVQSDTKSMAVYGSQFKSASDSKIFIEDCTFETEGCSAISYGICSVGENFCSIKNTTILSTLKEGAYTGSGTPSVCGIKTSKGKDVYCEGLKIICSGPKAGCYTTPFELSPGLSLIKDVQVTINGYDEYYFRNFYGGQCFVDNVVFEASQPGGVSNYLAEGSEINFSNCVFEGFDVGDASSEQININFGTGCSFSSKPAPSEKVHFTEELYRNAEPNQSCTGNDFTILKNYLSGSILSQLSAIVDGGAQ